MRPARRWLALVLPAVLMTWWALPAAAHRGLPPLPTDPLTPSPPPVTAEAWILYDATHDLVLGAENPDQPRPMASTTKIMTALIALEEADPETMVTVSETATTVVGSRVGLVPGEQVRLGELITGLLVRSGNDAALAIAEAVSGSVDAFVGRMNQRAAELGLENTHFANPHGIDTPGHYSTPRDLLTLAIEAMQHPDFAAAVALTSHRFPDAPDGIERASEATNLLLGRYPGLIGVKTGLTPRAGSVLVAAAERDGRRLYAVVMGSEGETGNFADAAALLDHGYWELMPTAWVLGEAGMVLHDRAPLQAAAEIEAMLHLAASGVLGEAEPVPEASPGSRSDPVVSEPSLPGLVDALAWLGRWWAEAGDG